MYMCVYTYIYILYIYIIYIYYIYIYIIYIYILYILYILYIYYIYIYYIYILYIYYIYYIYIIYILYILYILYIYILYIIYIYILIQYSQWARTNKNGCMRSITSVPLGRLNLLGESPISIGQPPLLSRIPPPSLWPSRNATETRTIARPPNGQVPQGVDGSSRFYLESDRTKANPSPYTTIFFVAAIHIIQMSTYSEKARGHWGHYGISMET